MSSVSRPTSRRHSWQSSSSSVSSTWSITADDSDVEASPSVGQATIVSRRPSDLSSIAIMHGKDNSTVALDLASYVSSESPLSSPISSPEIVSSYISKLSLSSPATPEKRSPMTASDSEKTPSQPAIVQARTQRIVSGFIPSPDRVENDPSRPKAKKPSSGRKLAFDDKVDEGGNRGGSDVDGSPVRKTQKRMRMPTPWPSSTKIKPADLSDDEEVDVQQTVDEHDQVL